MAYVAVKGGERAIRNAHEWLAAERRGDPQVEELATDQIREQLSLAVDRVMGEGSCYDRDLAALAIKQARGDLQEAVFMLRAYRTTLPRFGYSEAVDTPEMAVYRRVSAAFKDIPGGQVLGPTFDYTHRLLDFTLMANGEAPMPKAPEDTPVDARMPTIESVFAHEDLLQTEERTRDDVEPCDLTRQPMEFPAGHDQRLQALARGDEGFVLSLAYSTQRGWGGTHPLCAELRMGEVAVEFVPEELGFAIELGEILVTECQMISDAASPTADEPPRFKRGYGLVFGHSERKAMSMAIVDRALRSRPVDEPATFPAHDEEFVLYHSDNVEASGFVQHLKLPHYVDFQASLQFVRKLREEFFERRAAKEEARSAGETEAPDAATTADSNETQELTT
ncbi:MAG: carbon-phosphorus lyase complex subunit PhnI [Pseudomonadota bacterium]